MAGILLPVPGGLIGGALAGGALVAGMKWKKENMKRVRKYCDTKFKDNPKERKKCVLKGHLAIKAKWEKAKKKTKK